jgi:hypothetical protein
MCLRDTDTGGRVIDVESLEGSLCRERGRRSWPVVRHRTCVAAGTHLQRGMAVRLVAGRPLRAVGRRLAKKCGERGDGWRNRSSRGAGRGHLRVNQRAARREPPACGRAGLLDQSLRLSTRVYAEVCSNAACNAPSGSLTLSSTIFVSALASRAPTSATLGFTATIPSGAAITVRAPPRAAPPNQDAWRSYRGGRYRVSRPTSSSPWSRRRVGRRHRRGGQRHSQP